MSLNNIFEANPYSLYCANIPVSFVLKAIDFTTTGTSQIAQLPAGYKFIPTQLTTYISSLTGYTSAPIISVGSTSLSNTNIKSSYTLLNVSIATNSSSVDLLCEACPAGDTLNVVIGTGADATTYTGNLYVTGFLVLS